MANYQKITRYGAQKRQFIKLPVHPKPSCLALTHWKQIPWQPHIYVSVLYSTRRQLQWVMLSFIPICYIKPILFVLQQLCVIMNMKGPHWYTKLKIGE